MTLEDKNLQLFADSFNLEDLIKKCARSIPWNCRNAGNHGNDGKSHESHKILNQI